MYYKSKVVEVKSLPGVINEILTKHVGWDLVQVLPTTIERSAGDYGNSSDETKYVMLFLKIDIDAETYYAERIVSP